MNDIDIPVPPPQETRRQKLWKKVILPAIAVIIVAGISVGINITVGRHPEQIIEMQNYAYLSVFLISLLGNATVVFPGAVLVILANIAIVLYPGTGMVGPVLVSLLGGAGAALGELTGYILGYGGRGIVENVKLYQRCVRWMQKWGEVAIFVLSMVPFFFDLVGIAAGVLRVHWWRFLVFCWLGRSLMYTAIILLTVMGYREVLSIIG